MYCALGSYCFVVTEANHDNEFFEHFSEATALSIIRAYFSEKMKIRVQGTPNSIKRTLIWVPILMSSFSL